MLVFHIAIFLLLVEEQYFNLYLLFYKVSWFMFYLNLNLLCVFVPREVFVNIYSFLYQGSVKDLINSDSTIKDLLDNLSAFSVSPQLFSYSARVISASF